MKNYKICVCLFVLGVMGTKISAQNKECDYISSRYYHKAAQAELFWLEGNYKECYHILSELDSTCVLLNGDCNELYHFVELCLLYENYLKAFESIRSYITNYGVKLNDFKDLPNFRKMKKMPEWSSWKKELLSLEKNFVSDSKLYNEIIKMHEDCQRYNNIDSSTMKRDSIYNVNFQKLIHIISTKGFPLSSSIKYYHYERSEVFFALYSMLSHFASDSLIVNYFKTTLPQYIRQGDCPPDMLSSIIDMYQWRNKQLSLYGINMPSPEKIFEYDKLDERRRYIGLPDYELSKQLSAKRIALRNATNTGSQKKRR